MIRPHGADALQPLFVSNEAERAALKKDAEFLPSLLLNSAAAANAVMLGCGYFNPLTGFMNLADSLSVARQMKTTGGLFWPVPIVNVTSDVSAIKSAKRIALLDPNVDGHPVIAIQDVEGIEQATDDQMKMMAEQVFATTDREHFGV
jgi:sulfate adenylyltransferase